MVPKALHCAADTGNDNSVINLRLALVCRATDETQMKEIKNRGRHSLRVLNLRPGSSIRALLIRWSLAYFLTRSGRAGL
jgi:hypothetical protein